MHKSTARTMSLDATMPAPGLMTLRNDVGNEVEVMDRADDGSVDDVVGCDNVSTEVEVVSSADVRTEVDDVDASMSALSKCRKLHQCRMD